jgi:NAD(P)H-hydrate epimerase
VKIVSAAEMREIDRLTSERFGVPSLTLMENAGSHVAEFCLRAHPEARRIAIVCGKGNNGGDGFVAGRKLKEAGREVRVLLLADPGELRGDAAAMFARLTTQAIPIKSAEALPSQLAGCDLIVDAILGTGFRPPVTGLYAEAIAQINATVAPVVAVDIPSGYDADAQTTQTIGPVARTDAVVTFTAPRPAHVFAELTRGDILVAPIGSPDEAIVSALNLHVTTPRDIESLVALRHPEAHKGSFGHVLVIGGSLGKAGAAAMAGMGALRAGAGLVTAATPRSVLPTVASFAAELMTEPLEETETGTISLSAREYGRLDAMVQGKTVLALGPGISRNPDTVQFVRAIASSYPQPLVVDADGLNAFAGHVDKLNGHDRPLVLTPHPGEMARLCGVSSKDVQRDRLGLARKLAQDKDRHPIVVLKGHRTLTALPSGEVWVNTTGNPGMATGGVGDVLTGMIAGLIAQHPNDIPRAVAAAVYLHGLAGDIARETLGEHSLIATDLLRALPQAFQRTRDAARLPTFTFHG